MRTLNSSSRSRQRASVAAWLAAMLGAAVFVALTAAVGVWSMLHANGEVAALRESVRSSTSAHCDKEIELSVGPLIFGMVRAGLAWVDLEPEMRGALGAVRGASVGVYRLDQPNSPRARAGMVDAVDQAMARRGWERLLGVQSERECVLAYVPARIPSPRDFRLSVLVLEGEQLVVTSVRANPEPVIELLMREASKGHPRSNMHRSKTSLAAGFGL
jgi:hypothetical protein